MNYCIYIKKRKNKPFCKLLNEETTLCQCQQCNNKEYKTKNKKNSFYKSNRSQIKRKSSKLAKLERNRKSIFTDDLEHCYLCGQAKQEIHEIFCGRNRLNSIKYNLTLPLCHKCHSLNQNNAPFNDFWHKRGQTYFEENIGSREEFLRIFRKNYLD